MSALGEKVWGLENIARKLGISRRTLVRALSWPASERPPVRRSKLRGWYAYEERLLAYVEIVDEEGGNYIERERLRAQVEGDSSGQGP